MKLPVPKIPRGLSGAENLKWLEHGYGPVQKWIVDRLEARPSLIARKMIRKYLADSGVYHYPDDGRFTDTVNAVLGDPVSSFEKKCGGIPVDKLYFDQFEESDAHDKASFLMNKETPTIRKVAKALEAGGDVRGDMVIPVGYMERSFPTTHYIVSPQKKKPAYLWNHAFGPDMETNLQRLTHALARARHESARKAIEARLMAARKAKEEAFLERMKAMDEAQSRPAREFLDDHVMPWSKTLQEGLDE